MKYKNVLLTYTEFATFEFKESKKVMELVVRSPVDTVRKELSTVDLYPKVPNPVVVDVRRLSKKDVLIRLLRFGVETKFTKLGLETKLRRLGVETKFRRFSVDTKLTKLGVETRLRRFGVDTRFRRLGVDIKLRRLGVETKLRRLGVDTKPKRLGTLIKGRIDEANSAGSMKLLIYRSKPAVVETIVD